MASSMRAVLSAVVVLLACGLLSASDCVPTHRQWNLFALNRTYYAPQFPSVLSQYTGGTVIVSSGAELYMYQYRDATYVRSQYNAGQTTVYNGRVWTMVESVNGQYEFNALDDTLGTANYVLVNTSVPWATTPYWQTAVDEDAGLLYAAAMVDGGMQLHCWSFNIDDNNSSLLFAVTLPTPYLPATIYQGARHTLLLTYEDDIRIFRVDGYTGKVTSEFDAPGGVPTALVEAVDGSMMYVSAEWPNVAAVAAGKVTAYYYYSGVWDEDEPANRFISLVLSGDGEWLLGAAAVTDTPIMRWRVGYSHHIYAPHAPHYYAFDLNMTDFSTVGITPQYTGATIAIVLSTGLQRWQLNNSIFLSASQFTDFLATSFRGRVWTASNYDEALVFSVLDDQLRAINSWDVNSTDFIRAVQWQIAVDEEAGLLYSAAMIDQTMQLYAWQIGALGNTTTLAFISKLGPTPYLPANLYQGAAHTLLVTYQDDTHIYRICGYTGALLSVFNASTVVPTAVVESHDGSVLYVSYDWPSIAAYDSATGQLLMYYDYTEGWGGEHDTFSDASISGDGQWLFALAQKQTYVVQWRINSSLTHSSSEKGKARVAEQAQRVAQRRIVSSE